MTEPTMPAAPTPKGAARARLPLLLAAAAALGVLAWLAGGRAPNDGGRSAGDATPSGDPDEALGGVSVHIESDPPGASLFINSTLVGATPYEWKHAGPGTYVLRFEKAGRAPQSRRLVVGEEPASVAAKLPALSTGVLEVAIEPRGAEVLLDGELVGHTPLSLADAPAGQHELIVRKTNFKPFTARIEITPGEILRYADQSLDDKILAMLRAKIKGEPQRVAHYVDLGHYEFVNNRMDEAVLAFIQAQEVAETPLTFEPEVDEQQRALEQRLRLEDYRRLKKEVEKHVRWPGKNTADFREKLQRQQDIYGRKNIASWSWVQLAARNHIEGGHLTQAESLYIDHLDKNPNGENAPDCLLALLKVRLQLRNISAARDTYDKLFELVQDRPDMLLKTGQCVLSSRYRMPEPDRNDLLEMSEKAFRRARDVSKVDTIRAECAFELANALTLQGHAAEAIGYYEQSLEKVPAAEVAEERTLQMAEALHLAGRIDEAEKHFKRLTASTSVTVRERANAGLVRVNNTRKSAHKE
ncbi:MAG: PEGA domain-containing protein [Planctomycetes bacterium]|nr:PEGA domain-containing protein [Planctomycetota bacterium]